MRGRKWKLFLFWLSYIGWFILVILPFALTAGVVGALSAASAGAQADAIPDECSIVMIGAFVVSMLIGIFVVIYAAIGQAVFYRDAKAETCDVKAEIEVGGSEA